MNNKPSLARLDLNLLIALDALLTERSVTRAAERLGLSQPALSASLSRLRIHFGDEILRRDGNNYELTPLARRLVEHTTMAVDSARRVFETQADWDPLASTREFVIYGSDYSFATVGAVVARLAAERAPGVRFRFVLHTTEVISEAPTSLRPADGLLMPHGFLNDLPFVDLFSDSWVVVVAEDNAEVGDSVSLDQLAALPWVFTYQSPFAFASATRQVQQLGFEPRIECVVEGFMAIPSFVAGTRRLGMVQGHLAEFARRQPGIRVLETPFEATPIVEALWWHPIHDHDPEHRWMRELFAEAGRAV